MIQEGKRIPECLAAFIADYPEYRIRNASSIRTASALSAPALFQDGTEMDAKPPVFHVPSTAIIPE
jgi:hypothetical protein